MSMLKQIGNINIAGFSLLLPNSALLPHCDNVGPTYNTMGVNMFLIGKNSSLYVKINNKFEQYKHEKGKLVIFNSENEHYADNNGDHNRIILYINIGI